MVAWKFDRVIARRSARAVKLMASSLSCFFLIKKPKRRPPPPTDEDITKSLGKSS